MTDDFIDSTFSDLDAFYPGSKRKRKVLEPVKHEVTPDSGWDAKPKIIAFSNGNAVDMFTIGAVAGALGRPIVTIRAWIREGYLPASPYRLPSKKDVNGKDHQGTRLYSRAMVGKLIELLGTAGLLHIKRINWPIHRLLSLEIAEAWNNIRAEETKPN